MGTSIFPSDTAAVGGAGVYQGKPTNHWREFQIAEYLTLRASSPLRSFVASGMAVTAGTGLDVNVAAGTMMLEGRVVTTDAAANVPGLTASETNYIFAAMAFTSSVATGISWSANTTGTPPAYSVFVGMAVCDTDSVTDTVDAFPSPRAVEGTYTGDGTSSRLIYLGWQPSRTEVWGDYGPLEAMPFFSIGGRVYGSYITKDSATGLPLLGAANSINAPMADTLGFTVKVSGGYGLNIDTRGYYYRAMP